MMNMDYFKCKLKEMNLSLSEEQEKQFIDYYNLIIEYNKVMNLTGITEFEEVIKLHFLDSISIVNFFDFKNVAKIMDMGTGAGFPGIPLKIMFPNIDFVLVDSLKKRIIFLEEVCKKLNLKKIECIHARAEDLASQKEYRENFDLVVSRAVANLSTLSEYCIPFCKKEGHFIPYKSEKISEELIHIENCMSQLGASIVDKKDFFLDNDEIYRVFVFIKKLKKTPLKYPRRAGIPLKKPL